MINLSHLHNLNVGFNNITGIGISFLSSSLKYVPELIELGVGGNPIGDEGIKFLCNSLKEIPRLEIFRVFSIIYINYRYLYE